MYMYEVTSQLFLKFI